MAAKLGSRGPLPVSQQTGMLRVLQVSDVTVAALDVAPMSSRGPSASTLPEQPAAEARREREREETMIERMTGSFVGEGCAPHEDEGALPPLKPPLERALDPLVKQRRAREAGLDARGALFGERSAARSPAKKNSSATGAASTALKIVQRYLSLKPQPSGARLWPGSPCFLDGSSIPRRALWFRL